MAKYFKSQVEFVTTGDKFVEFRRWNPLSHSPMPREYYNLSAQSYMRIVGIINILMSTGDMHFDDIKVVGEGSFETTFHRYL